MENFEIRDKLDSLSIDLIGTAEMLEALAESGSRPADSLSTIAHLLFERGGEVKRISNELGREREGAEKKEATHTAATVRIAKMEQYVKKNNSIKSTAGQALFERMSFQKYVDVRKAYVSDWQYAIDPEDNTAAFFKILAIAYEAGRENGIEQERDKRKKLLRLVHDPEKRKRLLKFLDGQGLLQGSSAAEKAAINEQMEASTGRG